MTIIRAITLLLLAFGISFGEIEYYRVEETTAGDTLITIWEISESDSGYIVTSTLPDEIYIYYTDFSRDTYRWEYSSMVEDIDIFAHRENDSILIRGIFKGDSVCDSHYIGDKPWYQHSAFSLAQFALSDSNSIKFAGIRWHNLKFYDLIAEKECLDTVITETAITPALRVKYSPSGILKYFWHADFWFDIKTGRFVRYEAVQGLPGTPKTIILSEPIETEKLPVK